MSHALNNDWRPSASIENLKKRSEIIQKIRDFFLSRDVMEVDTPILNRAGSTDIYLVNFVTHFQPIKQAKPVSLYLQTSPEFYMKRLLAAGSGSIFQICKSFRNEEQGRMHAPEFTMLEWYRLDFDHHELMAEMDELLQSVLQTAPAEKISYEKLFLNYAGFNPHTVDEKILVEFMKEHKIFHVDADRDTHLQLILSELIEPKLANSNVPVMIYDFPASQAALAKIRKADVDVAERFEVYYRGMELANGFHELTDAAEQRARFVSDNQRRRELNLPEVPMDEKLLAALAHGMPDCSGVALGIDRVMMLALAAREIGDVANVN